MYYIYVNVTDDMYIRIMYTYYIYIYIYIRFMYTYYIYIYIRIIYIYVLYIIYIFSLREI